MTRVVFLGAGHASLIALTLLRDLGNHITLVSDGPQAHYSGLIPGWIEGLYPDDAMSIPLAPFAARCGVRLLERRVEEISPGALITPEGAVPYDILVVNIGAVAARPGALASPQVVPAKPITSLIAALRERLETAASFAILGAGPAGLEAAFALARRRPDAGVCLIEQREAILTGFPARFRSLVLKRAGEARIDVRPGTTVKRVAEGALVVADADGSETELAADCTIAFTGAAPPALLAETPFQRAPDGFLAVDDAMRSLSHDNVLAVGDVATNVADPRPKAGVFAVRAGRPLAEAVRALHAGRTPAPVSLQKRALVLLATGGRRAIGTRNGLVLEGRAVWRLKDRLDRAFVERFKG